MATDAVAPNRASTSNSAGEGSKFKRFLRKFGRKPSDDGQSSVDGLPNQDHRVSNLEGTASGTERSRKGSKSRGNSLLGVVSNSKGAGRSRNNSASQQQQQQQQQQQTEKKKEPIAFGGNSGQGLADTLVIPDAGAEQTRGANGETSELLASPPPQIGGLPSVEPLNATEVANSSGALNGVSPAAVADQPLDEAAVPPSLTGKEAVLNADGQASNSSERRHIEASDSGVAVPRSPSGGHDLPQEVHAAPALSVLSSSPAHSRAETSFDVDSTVGTRRRDSSDNHTMDTGKSTKPTTLMSLDTREASGTSGMASIAQYRHGDGPSSALPTGGSGGNNATGGSNTASPTSRGGGPSAASIQFANPPTTASRNPSSTASIPAVQLPGQGESADCSPYVNIPSVSRPHPSNNPTPSGIPADNASILTLASSTAAQSIGGAASSRGHYQTPSLGGARSTGGSVMGDRRNSSDTYASVKALPPQSRRGSDESTRTGRESVAPSSQSISGGHALGGYQGGNTGSTTNVNNVSTAGSGPGAPADRISMHRTNSQRTVATQLSIPLSTSASNTNLLAKEREGGVDKRSSTGSQYLLATGVGGAGAVPSPLAHQATGSGSPSSAGTADVSDGDEIERVAAAGTSSIVDHEHVNGLSKRDAGVGLPEITQTSPSPIPVQQPLSG
ncbi:unnamed protein product [Sympodiomycopsis kandeliae]